MSFHQDLGARNRLRCPGLKTQELKTNLLIAL
jgi:hypothetical protein